MSLNDDDRLSQTVQLLSELNEQANSTVENLRAVADALHLVKEAYEGITFSEDDLSDLAKQAAALVACLNSAEEAYQGDGFPTIDGLSEMSREAGNLARSLEAAS